MMDPRPFLLARKNRRKLLGMDADVVKNPHRPRFDDVRDRLHRVRDKRRIRRRTAVLMSDNPDEPTGPQDQDRQQDAPADAATDKNAVLEPDAGILSSFRELSMSRDDDPCRGAGFVLCVDGEELDDEGNQTGKSCVEACAGECCIAGDLLPGVCTGTTGRICRDGSCNGSNACRFADAGSNYIVNSCQGDFACYVNPPNTQGYLRFHGNVIDSCQGEEVCQAYFYRRYDLTTDVVFSKTITSSCNGDGACGASDSSLRFNDYVINSCNGITACSFTGAEYYFCGEYETNDYYQANDGYYQPQTDDYNTNNCDEELGLFNGTLSCSCNGNYSCSGSDKPMTFAKDLTYSCNGYNSCVGNSESITLNGALFKSCNGNRTCKADFGVGLPVMIENDLGCNCNNETYACSYGALPPEPFDQCPAGTSGSTRSSKGGSKKSSVCGIVSKGSKGSRMSSSSSRV